LLFFIIIFLIYFLILSLIVLFHLIFILDLVLILLIAMCVCFFFFWMIENFASWFFWVCLLWGNPGHGFWKLVWFDFSLFFLNWFFFSFSSFNIMLLGLHLCDFSRFPFYDVNSISHPGSRVSRANPGWVVFFLFNLSLFFLFNFSHMGLSRPHNQTANLTCWLKSGFLSSFKIDFF
jgi:hypothetical protein